MVKKIALLFLNILLLLCLPVTVRSANSRILKVPHSLNDGVDWFSKLLIEKSNPQISDLHIEKLLSKIDPDIYWIRIKLTDPTYASYNHAENPYDKRLVSIFQVDDSPRSIYNLMYPYFMGGTTAEGYASTGVRSTDGCGNDLFWTMSAACFVQNQSGVDLLEQGTNFISWSELATITANGIGLQRGFDFDNHGFGGSSVLLTDRYKQIYLNNKACYDKLGFQPEVLVIPGSDIGYRFGANTLGMHVTSQAGPDALKDGMIPLDATAYAEEIYDNIQNPIFIRRNHWPETEHSYQLDDHKSYILAAYNRSVIKPAIYNWFSHGPIETGTNNFNYYRQLIDYMQSLAGDDVIGMGLAQYLGYQKTKYAAANGGSTSSFSSDDGYLEINFDLSLLQNPVKHRLLSILIDSDGPIESIEKSANIQELTFNSETGLVNILLDEAVQLDPALQAQRPTINASSVEIPLDKPNTIVFETDMAIEQNIAEAYEVNGNSVVTVTEVPASGGLRWELTCENDFLSTDVVNINYKAENGDAVELVNDLRMLTYADLPVRNNSTVTAVEEESLAISVRRDHDDHQLATFNTMEELTDYLSSLNINTDISIVFNNSATYTLLARWNLNYPNAQYSITIKGKEGLSTYPVIDGGGMISDLVRVQMNHVRISRLKFRSGKYSADGSNFGDNYSGAILAQTAGTSDCQYTDLIFHQGMKGIYVGGINGSDQPNISNVLVKNITFTELTNNPVHIGIINSIEGLLEDRTDASYTLNDVILSNLVVKDSRDEQDIEGSGEKYHGQILCKGVNNLVIENIQSDQSQKQPLFIVNSKNIVVGRSKFSRFSRNTGSGFKAAIQIEGSEVITIKNCFIQNSSELIYISESSNIKLYHNTLDNRGAHSSVVALSQIRKVEDIQGNLFLGNSLWTPCIGGNFYRGNGYIPTLDVDFASEQNNLFTTQAYVFQLNGYSSENTNLTVGTHSAMTFDEYKTTHSRGQNSSVEDYTNVEFVEVDEVDGFLSNSSAGRGFVTNQISDISVDINNMTRVFPTDAGAYDADGIRSSRLSSLIATGNIELEFESGTTSYEAKVRSSTSELSVTAIPEDELATIRLKVNDGTYANLSSATLSSPLTLNIGDNLIELEVISSNGEDTELYTILVIRANEDFMIDQLADLTVSENVAYASNVAALTGIPFGDVKYKLTGPDALDFWVDHSTGEVSMIARNFENPTDANLDNVYEIGLIGTDEENKTASISWKVSITDVTETAVFSLNSISDMIVDENTVLTSPVIEVTGSPVSPSSQTAFAIVPIPDTQYYTSQLNGGTNSLFLKQTEWVVDKRADLNINYLVHLGDCVQNGDNGGDDSEWERVDLAMSMIEDPLSTSLPHGIPYGMNVGNHDQSPDGNANGTTSLFNQFFGTSRFDGRTYYGGKYGANNDNNFQLFTAGGMEFIAINLEYDPLANAQVLDWADALLKAYPDRRAIVSSHYILNPDGSFGTQGQAIYDKLKVNSNLFLMLCGHRNPNGESRRTDTYNGNTVHTLLSNYQDRSNGGNGWMRYMEFLPSENKILVSTFSPELDEFENDNNSRFELVYPMAKQGNVTYSLSGTDAAAFTIDANTGIATLAARNFEFPQDQNEDNIYELNIIATDSDANTASVSFKVTVRDVAETSVFTIASISDISLDENQTYTAPAPTINGNFIGSLSYSISGSDAAQFTIDALTGIVQLAAKDYELPQDQDENNSYELTITGTDEDGNLASVSWKVTINPSVPAASLSILSSAELELIADGLSSTAIKVESRDAAGNVVGHGGANVEISKLSGPGTVSGVTDNNDGTYGAVLTSPETAGSAVLVASINGEAVANGESSAFQLLVNFEPGAASVATSEITAEQVVLIADGISSTTINIKLNDIHNNALKSSGGTISLISEEGILSGVTDHQNGTYTALLTSPTLAGTSSLSAKLDGQEILSSVTIEFKPGAASALKSIIESPKQELAMDENVPITIRLNDANNNKLANGGDQVTIYSALGNISQITDMNDGTYTAILSGLNEPGEHMIYFSVNGVQATEVLKLLIINLAPIANSDSFCTVANTPLIINILHNDMDPEGDVDPLTIDLDPAVGIQNEYALAGVGNFKVNSQGDLTFTPAIDFFGSSSELTYTVKDRFGVISNSANIGVNVVAPPKVSISTDEGKLEVCRGGSLSFSAEVTDATSVTYQWYLDGTVVGTNSARFLLSNIQSQGKVSCTISSTSGCGLATSSASNFLMISVTENLNPLIEISLSNNTGTLCEGSAAVFRAVTTQSGNSPSFQWKVDGVNKGTNSPEFITTELLTGQKVTCEVTSDLECLTSRTALSNVLSVEVQKSISPEIAIFMSGGSSEICVGKDFTFHAEVLNPGEAPQYEWYINNTLVFTGAVAFTSSDLKDGQKVWCKIIKTDRCATLIAESNQIEVKVFKQDTPNLTIMPVSNQVVACKGLPLTYKAIAENPGTNINYQWFVNGNKIQTTGSEITLNNAKNGDKLQCEMISDLICEQSSVLSNQVTINVIDTLNPEISIRASNNLNSICPRASMTFIASIKNAGLSPILQWKLNGTIVGQGQEFKSSELKNGQVLTCTVTSDLPCQSQPVKLSNSLTIEVLAPIIPKITIGIRSGSDPFCGGSLNFSAEVSNPGNLARYEWKIDGISKGVDGPEVWLADVKPGNVVTCLLKTTLTCEGEISILSNSVIVPDFAQPDPSVTIQRSSEVNEICSGSEITFTAVVVNGGNSPFYQWKIDGQNVGANTGVFVVSSLKDGQIVSCSVISDLTCRKTAVSNNITVKLRAPSAIIEADGPVTFFTGRSVVLKTTQISTHTYQWLKNGLPIPGAISSSYMTGEKGSYSVRVLSGACLSISEPIEVRVVFELPQDHFKVSATAESCKSGNNGAIKILAQTPMVYTASITGPNKSGTYMFNSMLDINGLQAGNYQICIRVQGNDEFERCFTLNVAEPKDLSLYSSINTGNSTITLRLGGADKYLINLNGRELTSTESTVILDLQRGSNRLSVSTDFPCQGLIERNFQLATLYPNPFENELYINIGLHDAPVVFVSLISMEGKIVRTFKYPGSEEELKIDLAGISPGLYMLKLNLGQSETIYKVQKL